MKDETISLYWSASKPNVGDWLSPLMVAAQTSRPITHAKAKACQLMAIGSILHKAKNHWWSPKVDVWGSGFMHDCAPVKMKHRIHAVRGQLTRARIVGGKNIACGDPGLLVSSVLGHVASDQKKHKVGIIPHYWDRDDAKVKAFIKRYPDVKFLDIFDDVESFVHDLTECECILSSSLHGLVMADAFEIPNQWLLISDKVEGKNFKFHDYYSVFDMAQPSFAELENLSMSDIDAIIHKHSRPGLKEAQLEIAQAFPETFR